MQCFVHLTRKSGTFCPTPEHCRDVLPKPGDVISVHVDGEIVLARVERIKQGHTISASSGPTAVCYIIATEL